MPKICILLYSTVSVYSAAFPVMYSVFRKLCPVYSVNSVVYRVKNQQQSVQRKPFVWMLRLAEQPKCFFLFSILRLDLNVNRDMVTVMMKVVLTSALFILKVMLMMTIMTMMLCIGVDDDGNDYGYGYHGDNEDEVDEDDDENI